VVGFDAILETLADRPLDDDDVGAALASAAGRDSVAEDVGRRHREWLQVLGLLADDDETGESRITALGRQAIGEPDSERVDGDRLMTFASIVVAVVWYRS